MSKHATIDMIADVWLYSADESSRKQALLDGYRCPLFVSEDKNLGGWDTQMSFAGEPFELGTKRRVGFRFLSNEGATTIRQAGRFYLWETGFIGEGQVIEGAGHD